MPFLLDQDLRIHTGHLRLYESGSQLSYGSPYKRLRCYGGRKHLLRDPTIGLRIGEVVRACGVPNKDDVRVEIDRC